MYAEIIGGAVNGIVYHHADINLQISGSIFISVVNTYMMSDGCSKEKGAG